MPNPSVYIETTIVSYLTCWPSRDIIRAGHELLTRDWRLSFPSSGNDPISAAAVVAGPTPGTPCTIALVPRQSSSSSIVWAIRPSKSSRCCSSSRITFLIF